MKTRPVFFSAARLIGMLLNTLASISPGLAGRISFLLLGMPQRKKQKQEEQAFLATADLHFETINGDKVAVYHWGFRGPVVLLAHGWESHAGRWRKIAPPLVQAGFQVVAVDAPAHGRSSGRRFTMVRYADILRALLQRFGPIHALVAHSVGGAAGIWAMGTVSPALRPQKAVILASFSHLQTIMDGARQKVGASDALMAAMDAEIERVTGARIAHYSLMRQAEKLGDVDALLIHDRKDRVTAVQESEKLHRSWPGARALFTEGYGHGLTAPAVTETVLDFVQAGVVA
ncbi:MAG: alpha/beta hydrolase [Thermoanaerobaculia bacterium]|nr:alpha/beta hydrolase [Thermoanaerobaculia bacterium]